MSKASDELTVVSASGKVLLAGGYLVLDQKYSGVVVSTSSRFYTVVGASKNSRAGLIIVRSPQFKDATWEYDVGIGNEVHVSQAQGAATNKFVFIALELVLRLVGELKGSAHTKNVLANGLDITIVGGNDFYSQRAKLTELGLEPRISSLAQIPPFAYTGVSLSDVHKTGLGSSAALVTSLVGALLLHLGVVQTLSRSPDDDSMHMVHAASQAAHCIAQGKVGSGFDVAAAVYGSHRYTRFNPAVLSPLMSETRVPLLPVLGPSNRRWDHKVESFKLPPGTRLMLADVDSGSDTPSHVGKVLKWHKAAGDEAVTLWDTLAASNEAFSNALLRLSELQSEYEELYNKTLVRFSDLPAAQWASTASDVMSETLITIHRHAEDIRAKMRVMGTRAGVPIEPPEQTALLDACIAQPGVVAGGVPGAGGYDAVWVLVLDPHKEDIAEDTPLRRVEHVWLGWKDLDVSPLSATESLEKGLRHERVESVPGLVEALMGMI